MPERIGSVPEAEGKALFSTAEKGEESNGRLYFDQPEGVDSTYEDYVRAVRKRSLALLSSSNWMSRKAVPLEPSRRWKTSLPIW